MTTTTPRTDAFMLEINEGRVYATKGIQEQFARGLERECERLRAALDPETLEAIADEIQSFEHSARAGSLRVLAKRQREALEAK